MKRKLLVLSLLALAAIGLSSTQVTAWEGWLRSHSHGCSGGCGNAFSSLQAGCCQQSSRPYNAFTPVSNCGSCGHSRGFSCGFFCRPHFRPFQRILCHLHSRPRQSLRPGSSCGGCSSSMGGNDCTAASVSAVAAPAMAMMDPSLLPYTTPIQTAAMPQAPMPQYNPYPVQPVGYMPTYAPNMPTYYYYPTQPTYPYYGYGYGYGY